MKYLAVIKFYIFIYNKNIFIAQNWLLEYTKILNKKTQGALTEVTGPTILAKFIQTVIECLLEKNIVCNGMPVFI